MRIPGNKISHLRDFFYTELDGFYDRGEINAMFSTAASHVLGFSPTQLITRSEDNINQSDLLKLYDCAKALKKNIPLQYILGEAWFCGLKFRVNKNVLIPRPETEELVELITKENPGAESVLDLCTGSGCIAIALKKKLNSAEVNAIDISEEALAVAEQNALLNECDIRFEKSDLLQTGKLHSGNRSYSVVVSNPPYIKKEESASILSNVIDHEPHIALFVDGDDPIIFYKRIIDLCKEKLNTKGRLYFELNPLTSDQVKNYAKSADLFSEITLQKDMSGTTRFLKAIKK